MVNCDAIDSAASAARALSMFGMSVRQAALSAQRACTVLAAAQMTATTGPEWLEAHPGRRLPGSLNSYRLAKKRVKALRAWLHD